MPLSCVRRLDRNTPPLRDKRTPARAWSSSDLIYFWKSNSFKCKWGLLYEEGFNSEASYRVHRCAGSAHSSVSRRKRATSAVYPLLKHCGTTEACALNIWAVTAAHSMCHQNSHFLSLHRTCWGPEQIIPKTGTRHSLDENIHEKTTLRDKTH